MMGKTHYKLGVLWYVVFVVLPFIPVLPFLGNPSMLTIAGIAAAALGGLMPDMDSQHSQINCINPATGLANKAIDFVEDLVMAVTQLIFTVGLGALIIYNSKFLIRQLSSLHLPFSKYSTFIVYITAALLILIGISNRRMVEEIPVIGNIYDIIRELVLTVSSILKRIIMLLVYGGSGAFLVWYNFTHWHDGFIYIAGILLVGIAIFPHRTFLHSLEGLIMFSIVATYLADKVGYTYLAGAFIIGYITHLYLSDLFTNSGVPLSILPKIAEKTGLHKLLRGNALYKAIYKVLNIRLRVPIMSTGTNKGNSMELGYVLGMTILVGVIYMMFGGKLVLI